MKGMIILSFSEAKRCLGYALRYPVISSASVRCCGLSVVLAIASWFSLAGLPAENWVFWTVFSAYFAGIVSLIASATRTTEHSQFWTRSGACLCVVVLVGLNLAGESGKIFTETFFSSGTDVRTRQVMFRSLSDFIVINGLLCLLTFPFWLGWSLLEVRSFRNNRNVAQSFAINMLGNVPVILLQAFFSCSLSMMLFISAIWTYLSVVVAPVMAVVMGVYVVLVINQIEKGESPDFVMRQIAGIR